MTEKLVAATPEDLEPKVTRSITITIADDGGISVTANGRVGAHHFWAAAHLLDLMGDNLMAQNQMAQQQQRQTIAEVAAQLRGGNGKPVVIRR